MYVYIYIYIYIYACVHTRSQAERVADQVPEAQTSIVDEDKAKGKPPQGDDDGNNDEEGDEEEQQDDDPAVDPTDGQEGSWTHSCQLPLLVLPYEITPETLSRPES